MKHLLNILDLTTEELDDLIKTALDIESNPENYQDKCAHKTLATLFFEPSTRTRLSFESAMLSLGGTVLGFSSASASSTAKGESCADTIEVVSGYVDIIAMSPDTMYANLLSLKIAKKLVFADKTFLGGKDLENKKQFVDFEAVRDSFFSSGNVSISGEMPENLYLFSGGTIKESTSVADISEVSGLKALFGDPEINDTSIVTFVLRSENAAGILEKIEKSLAGKGFEPIHRMLEKIGEGDSWGSVSIKTAISNESRLMSIYDKEYKTLDKTLSIGVYRVAEK